MIFLPTTRISLEEDVHLSFAGRARGRVSGSSVVPLGCIMVVMVVRFSMGMMMVPSVVKVMTVPLMGSSYLAVPVS